MPFVKKQHCKTAHVLLSKACPLHNVPHKICKYPLSFDCNPVWLLYPASHYRENLDCLTVVQLQESVQCVDQFLPWLKESVINCLLDDFLNFLSYNPGDIDHYPATNNRNVWLLILVDIFELWYSATVAATFWYALCLESVLSHQCDLPGLPSSLTWISSEKQLLVNLMSKISKAELLSVLRKIPSHVHPSYKHTIKSCSFAITDLIITWGLFLLQLSSSNFILEFASLLPSSISLPYVENWELQIIEILKLEFGETVVQEIGMQPHCKNQSHKEKCYATRIEKIKNDHIYSVSSWKLASKNRQQGYFSVSCWLLQRFYMGTSKDLQCLWIRTSWSWKYWKSIYWRGTSFFWISFMFQSLLLSENQILYTRMKD